MQELAARCPKHPEKDADGVCARCGVFFCHLDRRLVDGKEYCEACSMLPEVDYLEAFRLEQWGKRDGWAWMLGIGGLLYALSGVFVLVMSVAEGRVVSAGFAAVNACVGAVGIGFWLRQRWARVGILVTPLALGLMNAATAGPAILPMIVMPALVSLAVYFDTRNRLFFRVPVEREKLRKLWHLRRNNRLARVGLELGIVSLILWPLAPLALLMSIVALRRVDLKAVPPIGRRRQAIAGIVLGAIGTVLAAGLVVAVVVEGWR